MSKDMTNISLGIRHRGDAPSATGRPFLLVLFGVFAVIMLVALLVGLQGYRAIADERNTTDEQRLAYGSLVNTVKAFDAAEAFSVSEYEGNDVLSMAQRTTGGTYVMSLFVHDGMLMQQYVPADASVAATLDPGNAHGLFTTETFRVAYENGLLTLKTDKAEPSIYLTCPQSPSAFGLERRTADHAEAGDE